MITLQVHGMTCDGCARAVEKAVKRTDAAARVTADFRTGLVDADTAVARPMLVRAIEAAGYEVLPG